MIVVFLLCASHVYTRTSGWFSRDARAQLLAEYNHEWSPAGHTPCCHLWVLSACMHNAQCSRRKMQSLCHEWSPDILITTAFGCSHACTMQCKMHNAHAERCKVCVCGQLGWVHTADSKAGSQGGGGVRYRGPRFCRFVLYIKTGWAMFMQSIRWGVCVYAGGMTVCFRRGYDSVFTQGVASVFTYGVWQCFYAGGMTVFLRRGYDSVFT